MATNAVLQHDTPVMTGQGIFHSIDVYSDRLVIHPNDFFSRLLGNEQVISYNELKGLHAFESSLLTNHWSQLIIVLNNGKSRALSFSAPQRHIAQKVKETIEDFLSRREVAPLMKTL